MLAVTVSKADKLDQLDQATETALPAQEVYPKVEYTSSNGRDPFQSHIVKIAQTKTANMAKEGVSLPSMTLQGMLWGGEPAQAIIDNKVVRVGETINGAEVISVGKEGVTLLYEGQTFILSPSLNNTIQKKKDNN